MLGWSCGSLKRNFFERGPAVTFSPYHRETALLNVQVLFVVPGGIVLGWGVVSPNKLRLECGLQAGLLIIQLSGPRGWVLMAWVISGGTNNIGECGLGQTPYSGVRMFTGNNLSSTPRDLRYAIERFYVN
jgi:hypothetical protein